MGYFDDILKNKNTKVSGGYFSDILQGEEPIKAKDKLLEGGYSVAPEEIQKKFFSDIIKPQTVSGQFSTVMPNVGGEYVKPPKEVQKQLEANKITSEAAKKFTKQSLQTILDKTINTEKGKIIIDKISSVTENIPLKIWSAIEAAKTPQTYKEVYGELKKAIEDPNVPKSGYENFAIGLQSSLPQTAFGVALSAIPFAGTPLSYLYWTALSADEEIRRDGKVTGLSGVGNIAIDVALDRVLGNSIEAMLKVGGKSLLSTLAKNGSIEGGTEVAQSLLKFANRYVNEPENRDAIIAEAKNYFKSGAILNEFAVGAVAGAGIAGATHIATGQQILTPQQMMEIKENPMRGSIKIGEEDPLIQEARKYKSAEKFVKAQTNAYHGSYTKVDKFEKGYFGDTTANNEAEVFYFTKSPKHATEYSREAFVRRFEGEYYDKFPEMSGDDLMKKLYEDAGANLQINPSFVDIKKPKVINWKGESLAGKWEDAYDMIRTAKSKGYDGVIFKNISDDVNPESLAPQDVVIAFEPEQIMTKSQLTEIWNKANTLTPEQLQQELKEPKKLPITVEQLGIKPKAPFITKREDVLLRQSIRKEVKLTKSIRQEQKKEIIKEFNTKNTEIQGIKKSINDYIVKNIDKKNRGVFLNTIKNSKTNKDLAKAFVRIDNIAEKQEIKTSISELKSNIEKLTESPSISADYKSKIKDIVSQYELTGHSQAIIDKLKSTQEYINKQQSTGGEIEMPQNILNKLKILSRIPKEQLTISQINGLKQEIQLLGLLGKTKLTAKESLYNNEKELRKQILTQSINPINSKLLENKPLGEKHNKFIEKFIKLRNYLQKTKEALRPISGLAEITGVEPMVDTLNLDFGNYLTFNDEALTKWYETTKDLTDGNLERIGAYAILQREGGLERLKNSGRSEDELNRLELTPKEMEAYNIARELFEEHYQEVKKYMLDNYNIEVGDVKNYVSFHNDFEALSDLELFDRFGDRADEAIFTKKVEQGFTKETAKKSNIKLELNIDKILRRHLDDVAYMLTMGRDIKQYFEIINSEEMREKLGDVGSLLWLQYLDVMARKGGTAGAKQIAVLDTLRKNISAGVLGFRLSSALVQFSSFADTIATIGSKYSLKGVANISTSKEWRDFIMDNFPEVKKAVGDDIAFREFGEGLLDKITRVGMTPLQFLDGIMRSIAAAGAYQKLAEKKGIEIDFKNPDTQLVQEATKLMRQSQGSSFFKDQPLAITAGLGLTGNKSVNKTLLTFQSFMLNRWDNFKRQFWRLGIKEKNYKKAFMSFVWFAIVASALEESLRWSTRKIISLFTGDDDDEEEFVKNMVLNDVQAIPLMGQLASSMMYSSNPVPVINVMNDIIEGANYTVKGKTLETKLKGITQATGGLASLFGRIPGASQLSQIIKGVIPDSEKSKSSGLPSLPSLPKLPKLPSLPKL